MVLVCDICLEKGNVVIASYRKDFVDYCQVHRMELIEEEENE